MCGKIISRHFKDEHYSVFFNQETGFFMRCEDGGFPEPHWSPLGPELIDLSITNYCERSCSFCYRKTSKKDALFLGLNEIESVISQASDCGTMQIALGGGNPNQHPQFTRILQMIREYGIIPSFTTNGDGLSDEVLRATADYCGAMAISVYPPYSESWYERMLERIRGYGIIVNLHAIIYEKTLDLWMSWIKSPPAFFKYVNAIVFLNYKPVRCGFPRIDKHRAQSFFEAVNSSRGLKIGFDSCSISGIVRWMNTPSFLLEPCEAARFSAFISEEMKMYPCSFMAGDNRFGNLRRDTLLTVWNENVLFKQYRSKELAKRCVGCEFVELCNGGCRLFDGINWC